MFNKRKISIILIAVAVIGAGLYWRGPLVRAAMQLLDVAQGVIRVRSSPKNGLVGYWNFDECDSCATAADKSGSGNTGTITDANASGLKNRASGKINQALNFDGTDDYVDAGTSVLSGNTGAFSASAWFKLDSNSSSKVIISKDDRTTGISKKMFQIQTTVSGGEIVSGSTLAGYIWDESLDTYLGRMTTAPLNLGQWYHVVFTYDGTTNQDGVLLYLNGVQYTGNYTGGGFAGIDTTNANFLIGAYINTGGSKDRLFDGVIDDVRIYNRALSADEITRLYEEGSYRTTINANQNGVMANGLIGMWSFNGPDVDWSQASAEARDVSGNGNHGDVTNFGKEAVRTGMVGQALSFDGVNDYVALTQSSILKPTSAFSVSAWVKRDANMVTWSGIYASPEAPDATGGFFLTGLSTNVIRLYIDTNGAGNWAIAASATVLAINQWYHVAATWTGSLMSIYINGVLDNTPVSVSSIGYGGTGRNAEIGRYSVYGNFPGVIDDVRVYNRALNAAEIQELYLSSARL